MNILLNPINSHLKDDLRKMYVSAITEAKVLYVVSAYLTEWGYKEKLHKGCEEVCLIAGTDFGLTRKQACKAVLNWLPKNFKNDFFAAEDIQGFHPKLIMWKDHSSKFHIVVGSSNLTDAAFTTNYEANIYSRINRKQYSEVKRWIESIRNQCTIISEDWIKRYKEAPRKKKTKQTVVSDIALDLPSGNSIDAAIKKRRKQKKAFLEIKRSLKKLIKKGAKGLITGDKFYDKMKDLWGDHSSRFQGSGYQRTGKAGDWKEICQSLDKVLDKSNAFSVLELDNLVKAEVDKLARTKNPNRGSWLSEMLCQYFPDKYPVINNPVTRWMKDVGYQQPRGATQGAKYIALSIILRKIVDKNQVNIAKDLAESDHAIWQWNKDNPKK